ncbi:MAG: GNAT family N-acetyltransferase [Pseudomonadota bacterium]
MSITLRPAVPDDAKACGTICYEAFSGVAKVCHFPSEFASADQAIALITWMIGHAGFYGVVAERDRRIVGSNFLDLRGDIAGVGPVTVDQSAQNGGIGRRLMEDVLRRAEQVQAPSIRLVQAAAQGRSLALYTELGFDVREPLACMNGKPPKTTVPGHDVRPARPVDLAACSLLTQKALGHDRKGELRDAISAGSVRIVEREGHVTGYSTGINYTGHTVAASNSDMKALIGAAVEFGRPGFLLPMRNADLFRWCLEHGLKISHPLTLMSKGDYADPTGAFLPSIMY